MDADRFDSLAKCLVTSELCLARGAGRRLPAIACAVLSRRRALKAGAGLILGGVLPVLGVADEGKAAAVDDAQCPAPGPPISGFGRKRFAQTFRAKHTGLLTQATVQLSGGSIGVVNAYLIEVRKTSRKGKPTQTLLSSQFQTILMDRPPSGTTTPIVANFSTPAPVKKDKRYALVLTQTNGTPSLRTTSEGCSGSIFEDDDLDNVFVKSASSGDIVFATVVTT